ncbi:hypothetical protein B296_00030900 [Ensete ventricosum]|uniref:Uncharacterized protein n=1 Tax=Ensete ventricosum TaxID=4639 RepID=A0A426YWQ2_ENSVE|nr:hypothetical protein B296_00030900 [Ensete ventricosum]
MSRCDGGRTALTLLSDGDVMVQNGVHAGPHLILFPFRAAAENYADGLTIRRKRQSPLAGELPGYLPFLSAPSHPPVAVPDPTSRPPLLIEVINDGILTLVEPATGSIPKPRKSSVAGFGPNNGEDPIIRSDKTPSFLSSAHSVELNSNSAKPKREVHTSTKEDHRPCCSSGAAECCGGDDGAATAAGASSAAAATVASAAVAAFPSSSADGGFEFVGGAAPPFFPFSAARASQNALWVMKLSLLTSHNETS